MTSDLEQCQAWIPGGMNWIRCGEPGIEKCRFACMHEHVIVQWACSVHHPQRITSACSACENAGHRCLMNWQAELSDQR